MERLSNYQLFTLVSLYEIGSTIIFGFASNAGRGAWIAVLISTAAGVAINVVYFILLRMNPGLTLVEWFPAQFGKWIGLPISWIYALEFMYDGGRGLGDLKILVPSTILPRTPVYIIQVTFMILITYALFSGVEIIARLGEMFLPLLLLVYLIDMIFIICSGIIHIQYIKPIMGEGWSSVMKAVWPLGITQTFGQTIEFTMIWPLINKQGKILKATLLATIISGIFIAAIDLLALLVLGENTFSHSLFPIYRMIRVISIGEFIENVDAINVIFFLTTAFFKLFIHLWCAVRAIQILTFSKRNRKAILFVIIIVSYMGMNMAENSAEHLSTGLKIVPYSLWVPLFYVLPILLFIVTLLRKKIKSKPDMEHQCN
ncbi:MAG: endospore germination permease [Bacillota bacterium]|nr:endospore germination permease [Bacillota bacterium]